MKPGCVRWAAAAVERTGEGPGVQGCACRPAAPEVLEQETLQMRSTHLQLYSPTCGASGRYRRSCPMLLQKESPGFRAAKVLHCSARRPNQSVAAGSTGAATSRPPCSRTGQARYPTGTPAPRLPPATAHEGGAGCSGPDRQGGAAMVGCPPAARHPPTPIPRAPPPAQPQLALMPAPFSRVILTANPRSLHTGEELWSAGRACQASCQEERRRRRQRQRRQGNRARQVRSAASSCAPIEP
jgi:hypothetical protein